MVDIQEEARNFRDKYLAEGDPQDVLKIVNEFKGIISRDYLGLKKNKDQFTVSSYLKPDGKAIEEYLFSTCLSQYYADRRLEKTSGLALSLAVDLPRRRKKAGGRPAKRPDHPLYRLFEREQIDKDVFAKRCGIGRKYLDKILRGEILPGTKLAVSIAKELGVSVEELKDHFS
ncbi:helix-turn-helix domain-containing protein, partial [bacterium]|nr:helix-turn-helix domain-containing protein [bacterium]